MTPDQFIARAMALPGLPWRRWCAGWDGADCFGLVVLWHREVLGIELKPVAWGDDRQADFNAHGGGWVSCDPEPGATAWMAWHRGAPAHCGILALPGLVLHSDGYVDRPGLVRLTRLSALQRLHPDLRFYRRAEVPAC